MSLDFEIQEYDTKIIWIHAMNDERGCCCVHGLRSSDPAIRRHVFDYLLSSFLGLGYFNNH